MMTICSTLNAVLVPPWHSHHIDHHHLKILPFYNKTSFSNILKNPSLHHRILQASLQDDPSSKQSQMGYDHADELYGLDVDIPSRDAKSDASEPRSWFGPNGQYIRELPCPNCRGRGYTPCAECGIERSRKDCSLCSGKGIMTCQKCMGECVIWEESIDEIPWEKARSRSVSEEEDPQVENNGDAEVQSTGGDDDWTTSILLFLFWAALIYYVFNLAPNQTPTTDMYFLRKLSNLVGDDGFRMNQVLVSLWYIMGLWPIVYTMLLLPSARSSKSSIPVWPFVSLSFFGGAYALIPYFILWRPPPPPVNEDEVRSWPLNFLESKITAGIVGAAGLGLIVYAGLGYNDWKEFYQYFSSSKLVHATTLDFSLLSAFAPFWVYNDMTARKCYDKSAWLLPLSIVPFLGPALYLLLRPPLTTLPVSLENTLKSD